jgi:hypothetical protein
VAHHQLADEVSVGHTRSGSSLPFTRVGSRRSSSPPDELVAVCAALPPPHPPVVGATTSTRPPSPASPSVREKGCSDPSPREGRGQGEGELLVAAARRLVGPSRRETG